MIDKKQDKKAYAHAEKAYMQGTQIYSYLIMWAIRNNASK